MNGSRSQWFRRATSSEGLAEVFFRLPLGTKISERLCPYLGAHLLPHPCFSAGVLFQAFGTPRGRKFTGARPIGCHLIAHPEGDFAAQHVGHLIAVAVKMGRRFFLPAGAVSSNTIIMSRISWLSSLSIAERRTTMLISSYHPSPRQSPDRSSDQCGATISQF